MLSSSAMQRCVQPARVKRRECTRQRFSCVPPSLGQERVAWLCVKAHFVSACAQCFASSDGARRERHAGARRKLPCGSTLRVGAGAPTQGANAASRARSFALLHARLHKSACRRPGAHGKLASARGRHAMMEGERGRPALSQSDEHAHVTSWPQDTAFPTSWPHANAPRTFSCALCTSLTWTRRHTRRRRRLRERLLQ